MSIKKICFEDNFNKELDNIYQLIKLPEEVKETTVLLIGNVLKNNSKQQLLYPNGERQLLRIIETLNNVDNGSLKKKYAIVYNQLCILAVSSLSANLENIFINYIDNHIEQVNLNELKKIKVDLKSLKDYKFYIKKDLGRIILKEDSNISFQNLEKTINSINRYFKKNIFLKQDIKDKIVFYQQCRHVLVHRSGKIDKDFLQNIYKNIKKYNERQPIDLDLNDWYNIKISFSVLIREIEKHLYVSK